MSIWSSVGLGEPDIVGWGVAHQPKGEPIAVVVDVATATSWNNNCVRLSAWDVPHYGEVSLMLDVDNVDILIARLIEARDRVARGNG